MKHKGGVNVIQMDSNCDRGRVREKHERKSCLLGPWHPALPPPPTPQYAQVRTSGQRLPHFFRRPYLIAAHYRRCSRGNICQLGGGSGAFYVL